MRNEETSSNSDARRYDGLSLGDIRTALIVAKLGSFRRAGINLGIAQSGVSRRIQKIEDALGVSLFERTTSGAAVTSAGKNFVRETHTAMAQFDHAADQADGAGAGKIGSIAIGISRTGTSKKFLSYVSRYMTENPSVDVRIVDGNLFDLAFSLSRRRLDLLFSLGRFPEEYGDSLLFLNEEIQVALPLDHPLAGERKIRWHQLRGERVVMSCHDDLAQLTTAFLSRSAKSSTPLSVIKHQVGADTLLELVSLGFGMAVVTASWPNRFPNNIVHRPLNDDEIAVPFTILWRPENDNPALRRFISLARIESKQNGALS